MRSCNGRSFPAAREMVSSAMNVAEQWTEGQRVKLTDRDFLQLAKTGGLDAYPKTELIDGIIVSVSPQHSRHGRIQGGFYRRLADAVDGLGGRFEAFLETSIRIGPHQVPQADIVVSDYRGAPSILPAASVALVVEIADTSAQHDRTTKARIYAQGGIPEYWVLDILAGEVVRFAQPGTERYGTELPVPVGTVVKALTIPGLAVDTAGMRLED